MIELKIDNIKVKVAKGTTVLQAAESIGIKIPTMCYLKGYSNHPSCMICVVKDNKTNNLQPSCALLAEEGMEIISSDEDVINSRKEALELLLSDHVGDCEAPCTMSCPANMDIPLMNRLIAKGDFAEAIKVVKETIALPLVLGYICAAPCEKACRRKDADKAVSICELKKFVSLIDSKNEQAYYPPKKKSSGKKVAIIGSGAAGLSAAYYLLKAGHDVILFDKNKKAGGNLRYEIPENELPQYILDKEIEIIKNFGAEFILNKNITKEIFETEIKKKFDAIVLAAGDYLKSEISTFGFNSTKTGVGFEKETFEVDSGVFACGSILKNEKMAIRVAAQGRLVALSVDSFLKGNKPEPQKKTFNSKFGKLKEAEVEEYLKEANNTQRLEPKIKLDGFTVEEAKEEAKRCMRCDCRKKDNCKLRDFSDEYEADRRKFLFGERNKLTKQFNHDTVVYEAEKCIRCGLCVDICEKSGELVGLAQIGRGFDVRIQVPFSSELSEALTHAARLCVEACPTGALAFKGEGEG
ncbi:MAG: FAD-dependent oxidoreductase [Saprospiraceae bacterium]|nr:FAD-dependent oxidoreductase [Saprospiraceae bacterium]